MFMGIVQGTVWGSQQALGLAGAKLCVVRDGRGREVVCADPVGANVGETVLVANGSRVRDLTLGPAVPVKTVLVAIVDGEERG